MQCSAAAATEYEQLDAITRITSTFSIADCATAHGSLTFAVRVRDEAGGVVVIEFEEPWQRSDNQDARVAGDYPIGENVELLNVRIGSLQCTCGDPSAEEAETATPEPAP
jgi:carbamoylphosphate synthase large subunit